MKLEDRISRLFLAGLLALFFVALAFLLGGCSSWGQVHADLKAKTDFSLDAAQVLYCDAPTLGALRREYAGNMEGLRNHLIACGWSPGMASALLYGLDPE